MSPQRSLEGSPHTPERKREGQCPCCCEISSAHGDLCQGLAVLWVPPAGGTWGPGPGCLSVNVADSPSPHPLGASLSAPHHGRQGASLRAVGGLARGPALCPQPLLLEGELNTRPPPGHQVRADGGTGTGGRALGPRLNRASPSPEGRSEGPWAQQRQFSKTKSFCLAPMTCIAEPHDFSAAIDTNVNWANL